MPPQVGTMAGISDDVNNLRVNRYDFMNAFNEVQPAFGVAEEELQQVVQNGIIHFAPHVDVRILPLRPEPGLTSDRNYSIPVNSSLSKSGRPRGHRSSVYSYMGPLALGRLRWRPALLLPLVTLSSNSYPRIQWSGSRSLRRSLSSTKSSRIVTRVH